MAVTADVVRSVAMALQELEHLDEEMRHCIDNCFEAAQACEWCADACAGEGEEMARCIRLCRDAADITALHARFMARQAESHAQLAGLCADVAEECADECASHDMDHCQTCAEVLRESVDSCREMAA